MAWGPEVEALLNHVQSIGVGTITNHHQPELMKHFTQNTCLLDYRPVF